MNDLYIGLMSGTSLDGVDGVLVTFGSRGEANIQVLAHAHRPFASSLTAELMALNSPGEQELHRAALAGTALALVCNEVVGALLDTAAISGDLVTSIGAHGQTVRHCPGAFDGIGYTLQLNNPALLAELTGIDVIADFRSRDVAAGGQGAPLAPAFHRAVFGRADTDVAVLNIGGFSNLTVLQAGGATLGFDCGPGNALMDLWCLRHTGRAYDDEGAWAASGRIDAALLAALRAEPFFAAPPPKSTGRDLFHAEWLAKHLALGAASSLPPNDVQATLAELTASICADDLRRFAPLVTELLVGGGGAFNRHVMTRLSTLLAGVRVMPTSERGLPPDQVEACAFAWLAREFGARRAGNLPAVTGAKGERVLGALYPA